METETRSAESKLALELAEGVRSGEWEAWKYIPLEKTTDALGKMGLKLASGEPYETVRIIPSELFGEMYEVSMRAGGHVVFGKLSAREREVKPEERGIKMTRWESKTGGYLYGLDGVVIRYGQNN